jgi:hypothetical protein
MAVTPFFSFTAVTAAFFGHTNYRSYLDLYWIVFTAGFVEQLRSKFIPTKAIQLKPGKMTDRRDDSKHATIERPKGLSDVLRMTY